MGKSQQLIGYQLFILFFQFCLAKQESNKIAELFENPENDFLQMKIRPSAFNIV